MYTSDYLRKYFSHTAKLMSENKDLLGELDAALGDGDLGVYMEKGFVAGARVAETTNDTPSKILLLVGSKMMEEAPSTLGTLLGAFFRGMGNALPVNLVEFDFDHFLMMLSKGYDQITELGKAKLGEKTILDTIYPAIQAMKQSYSEGLEVEDCLYNALLSSQNGLVASTQMKALHGRPAYFGDKTIGMQDGGALVGTLMVKSLFESFSK